MKYLLFIFSILILMVIVGQSHAEPRVCGPICKPAPGKICPKAIRRCPKPRIGHPKRPGIKNNPEAVSIGCDPVSGTCQA